MARLRRIDCSDPGITRRRNGKGFLYFAETGDRIQDPALLAHLKGLAIPPAWRDVWICPYPNGHLQAVGVDAAGRRQYIYHERWRARRDAEKFDHTLRFARALPRLRRVCDQHLAQGGFGRDRVLACAVRLLDHGFFRIGTESYAEENNTFGLATLKKHHVRIRGEVITFDYVSKGGQRRIQSLVNPEVRDVVVALKRRRGGGDELLAYKDGRLWTDVKSSDINDYIRDVTGDDFTAKTFRTWSATVLAAVALAVSGEVAASKTARKRAMSRAVKEIAHYLGNTPAVCRASYIDSRVFDRYRSGWTIAGAIEELGEGAAFGDPATQGAIEEAVIDLLEDRRSSDALEKVA